MSTTIASASVTIRPDLSVFKADLEAGVRSAARTATSQVVIGADTRQATADVDALRGKIEALRQIVATARVNLDDGDARAHLDAIEASLNDFDRQTYSSSLGLRGAEDVDAKVRLVAEQLSRISGQDAVAAIDIRGAEDADAKLALTDEELNRIDGRTATANVRVDGTDDAARGLTAAGVGASSFTGALFALGPAAVAAVAALAPAIGILGTLPGLFAGLGTGIGATMLGFSGIGNALSALDKEQTTAATSASSSARAQQAAASAVAAAAQQVRDAKQALAQTIYTTGQQEIASAEAVKNAEQGLADAERNSDQQRIQAAEQVARARESLATTEQSVADRIRAAAESVASAQYAVVQADQAEVAAEQQLSAAREQAARDLESAANRQTDATLAQQQATLDVQAAQDSYNQLLTSGTATATQLAQASLDITKAQQRLVEANQEVTNATEDNTKAQKEGVDGAPGVVSATQGIANAKHNQQAATQQLADATRAQTEEQKQGAREISDALQSVSDALRAQANQATTSAEAVARAQQGVTDALRAQQNQQEQASYQIQRAQEAVTSAMRSQAQANEQLTASGSQVSTAANAAAAAMAKLSPAGREFVTFLHSLTPDLDRLKATAQSNLLPGLEEGIKAVLPLMPLFDGAIGQAASGIGEFFANLGHLVASPAFSHDLAGILQTDAGFMRGLGDAALHILDALKNVAVAAEPLITALGQMADGWARNLDALSKTDRASGALASFFDGTRVALHDIGQLVGNVFGAIEALFSAAAPSGQGVVQSLIDMTGRLKDFLQSASGQNELRKFFTLAETGFTDLVAGITAAAHLMSTVLTPVFDYLGAHPAFAKLAAEALAAGTAFLLLRSPISAILGGLQSLVPAVEFLFSPAGLWVVGIAAVGFALYEAYQHSEGFRAAVGQLVTDVQQLIAPALTYLHDHIGSIQTAFKDVTDWITANVAPTFTAMVQFLDAVVTTLTSLWRTFGGTITNYLDSTFQGLVQIIDGAFKIIQGIFEVATALLTGHWSKAWQGIKDIVAGVWDVIKGVVTTGLAALNAVFSAAGTVLDGIWSGIWHGITSIAETIWHGISKFFTGAFSDFASMFSSEWHGIAKVFNTVWRGIESGAAAVWDGIRGVFVSGINDVISLLDDFIGAIDDVLSFFHLPTIGKISKVSAPTSHGPNLVDNSGHGVAGQALAAGGTIGGGFVTKRPTAIVGEGNPHHPEYVIPTDPAHRDRAVALYQSLGTQLLDSGGILNSVGSALSGALGGIADVGGWITQHGAGAALNLAEKPLQALLDHLPTGFFQGIAKALVKLFNRGALSLIGASNSGSSGGPVGAGVANLRSAYGDEILQVLQMLGLPASDLAGVLNIIAHEDGSGVPGIVNNTDSNWAAGHPSVGLMQVIQGTFDAYAGPFQNTGPFSYGVSTDPLANIYAGVNYALNRYGAGMIAAGGNRNADGSYAPYAAGGVLGRDEPQFSWYDKGGVLNPGVTVAMNGTGSPETVLATPPDQFLGRLAQQQAATALTTAAVQALHGELRALREDVRSLPREHRDLARMHR